MASIERRGDAFRVIFVHDGRRSTINLGRVPEREAERSAREVEESMRLIRAGRMEPPPPGADLGVYLMSGGRSGLPRDPRTSTTLGELLAAHRSAHAGALEPGTLALAEIHARHLLATHGAGRRLDSIAGADLQRHVDRRRREGRGRRGRPLSAATIRKELATLSAAWGWALRSGLATAPYPGSGLVDPRSTEPAPFRTRAEIEREVGRGDGSDAGELWASLFLDVGEAASLVAYARAAATRPWVGPAVALAAWTGMRRSEVLRARVADADLEAGVMTVREKKRAKGTDTTRRVPIARPLAGVLVAWLGEHPGGLLLVAESDGSAVNRDAAQHHFRSTLAGSPWEVVRGWHVLRHSFALNCAAAGVDARSIDAWLGHTTEEMRRRYRHLFPSRAAAEIGAVFG